MRQRLAYPMLAVVLATGGCGDDSGGNGDGDGDGSVDDADASITDGAIDAIPLPDAVQPSCTPQSGMTVGVEEVVTGLDSPVFVTSPPGDARLFVLEQPGRVRIVQEGQLLERPFLDLSVTGSDDVDDVENEQGLLGLAFHPDYAVNGRFFVNYTAREPDDATVVAEFTVSGDPNVANPEEQRLLTIPQLEWNHNGGMIDFGPEGNLLIGMGDGGDASDPQETGQDETRLLGKMLRIDVDSGDPYAIPGDNPFADSADGPDDPRPEIWALGLRNPWRWSFDEQGGNLYIGDVGQNTREEVNGASDDAAGLNYGWDVWEGTFCHEPPGNDPNCDAVTDVVDPIAEYDHGGDRCSVTGGYVYRGTCMPDLDGWYFYADFCSAQFWRLKYENGQVTEGPIEITSEIGVGQPTSFGVDATGEMYVVNRGGTIYELVPGGQ